jgi:hypothetical protein
VVSLAVTIVVKDLIPGFNIVDLVMGGFAVVLVYFRALKFTHSLGKMG